MPITSLQKLGVEWRLETGREVHKLGEHTRSTRRVLVCLDLLSTEDEVEYQ